jgi:hypothetical protein
MMQEAVLYSNVCGDSRDRQSSPSSSQQSLDALFSLFVDQDVLLDMPAFSSLFPPSTGGGGSSDSECDSRSSVSGYAMNVGSLDAISSSLPSSSSSSPSSSSSKYAYHRPPYRQLPKSAPGLMVSGAGGKGRPRKLDAGNGPENASVSRRRERNRLAAERCRLKKLTTISQLQGECERLRRERDILLQQLQRLQQL